jgi:hypothetical protein
MIFLDSYQAQDKDKRDAEYIERCKVWAYIQLTWYN